MKWIKCSRQAPEIGEEVLFYKNEIQMGYLKNTNGSSRPVNWEWHSHFESHMEEVYFWMPLPEVPND